MCPDASVPGARMWSRFPPPRPGRAKGPAPSPMYLSMRHRGIHKTSWTQGLARSSSRRPIVQRAGLHDQPLAAPAWVRRRGLGRPLGKFRSRVKLGVEFHSTAYWWCRFTSYAQSGETHIRAAGTTALEDTARRPDRSTSIRGSRLLGYQAGSPRQRLWVCSSWLFVAKCGGANRAGTIRAILHLTTI